MSDSGRMIQSPATRLRALLSYNMTQMLYVAARLGIADLLAGGPRHADDLARTVGAHPRSLYRLLRALSHVGVFAEDEQRCFRLTPMAQLLRADAPGSLRAFALSYGAPWWWGPWGRLMETVQTGRTAFEGAMEQGFFEYLDAHPDAAAVFNANMTSMTEREVPEVVATYDFSGPGTLVDVGGGHGALVSAILQKGGRAKATLFDRPAVIEGARGHLAAAGMADRCTLVAGSFFESIPAGGETYTLKDIIHDWDDARAVAILRNCRRAMSPGAKLLLIERVLPPDGEPNVGKVVDITMMVLTGGMERTEAEYRNLLEQAGFALRRVVFMQSAVSVLEAVPG
ncbi:MAG TPA: methyltransferase [Burkholderiaceae bacterium]|nr:methyltransferase [Burkholderiaceae bacterium]